MVRILILSVVASKLFLFFLHVSSGLVTAVLVKVLAVL